MSALRKAAAPRVVTIPYTPRPAQKNIHDNVKRFTVVVFHRRAGKTVGAINELIKQMINCPHRNPQGAYIAPTAVQARRVAWGYMKEFAGGIPGVKFNETLLRVTFPRGADDTVTIYLLGVDGDSAEGIRGLYLDYVVADEYASWPSDVYDSIIRPALSDRRGGCLWIGTPKGANAFKDVYDRAVVNVANGDPDWAAFVLRASESGILPADELEAAKASMDESVYAQEYECSWAAALQGAYYAKMLEEAELGGRIGIVPYDRALPVHVSFDLGVSDSTAIWFFQEYRRERRYIDYYEASGEGLPHYVKVVTDKPYTLGEWIMPHDIMVRELGTGASRLDMLKDLGVYPLIAPKVKIQDRIEKARAGVSRCWFDAENCEAGLKALRHYHREWDAKRSDWRNLPKHDWASHASDAFSYGFLIDVDGSGDWGKPLEYGNRGIV